MTARAIDVRLLGRHQVAAAVATLVDFLTMVLLVEGLAVRPAFATVASACFGGLVNFRLARSWAFRARHEGTLRSQAVRYALVSFGGALLNGALLGGVLRIVDLPYPLARALVAIAVSVAYTYPLHTRIVFRVRR